MRTILILVVAAVSACASGSGGGSSVPETISIGTTDNVVNTEVRVARDRYVAESEVSAPLEAVWESLPEAFAEVGLPAPGADEASRIAMVRDHVVRRRLGDQRLSRLLECGRGMTQPHADSHRIYLTVAVRLEEAAEGVTGVATEVTAVAENPEGTTAPARCTSRGVLESLLADAIRRVAGR